MIGRLCLAHVEHEVVVPIEQHHVRPQARGGRGTATVQLCANAHGQVHALLDRIEAAAVSSPFATTREVVAALPRNVWAVYPGAVRVIAYRGWLAYGLAFISGAYAEEYRWWTSAGTPKAPDVPVFADLEHAALWSRRWRRALIRNEGGARYRGQRKAPDRSRGRSGA